MSENASNPRRAVFGTRVLAHDDEPDFNLREVEVTRTKAHALLEAGVFLPWAAATFVEMCGRLAPWRAPGGAAWQTKFRTTLLGVGTSLLGVAAIFFFAANWRALDGWTRIALISTTLAASAALALRFGLDRPSGKAALTFSGLLVGPLLSVYGQVFQTGADAYEVFALWALLLLPYTALVRWPGLIVFQIVLAEVAYGLFAVQSQGLHFFADFMGFGVLAACNGMAFAVVEFLRHRVAKPGTLHGMLSRALVAASLGLMVPASSDAIRRFDRLESWPELALLLGLSVVVVIFFQGRLGWVRERIDPFLPALLGFAWMVTLIEPLHRFLRVFHLSRAGRNVGVGLFILMLMACTGYVARRVAKGHREADDDEAELTEGVAS